MEAQASLLGVTVSSCVCCVRRKRLSTVVGSGGEGQMLAVMARRA